jgi:hypothetical protein
MSMSNETSLKPQLELSAKIGRFFPLRDFVHCSDAWKRLDSQGKAPANLPQAAETIREMERLATEVLDRVVDRFGKAELTYGFCVPPLTRHIKERIEPRIDQHAGHELNARGKRICERDGFAVDFRVPGVDGLEVAKFVVEQCAFDRLYFYERDLPIHVSAAPAPQGKVVLVHRPETGFVRPRTMSKASFLDWIRQEKA